MIKYLKNEQTIGGEEDTRKGEKIGGINKSKLIKVYLKLKEKYSNEINFKRLTFSNFVDYVIANEFEDEHVKMNTLHYELKDNPLYEL